MIPNIVAAVIVAFAIIGIAFLWTPNRKKEITMTVNFKTDRLVVGQHRFDSPDVIYRDMDMLERHEFHWISVNSEKNHQEVRLVGAGKDGYVYSAIAGASCRVDDDGLQKITKIYVHGNNEIHCKFGNNSDDLFALSMLIVVAATIAVLITRLFV